MGQLMKGISIRMICFVAVFSVFGATMLQTANLQLVSADAVSDLQKKLEANKKLQEQNEQSLTQTRNNAKKEQEYQAALVQQIDLLVDNMNLLEEQIEQLNADMAQKDTEITTKQGEIDHNYELFKKRVRALYMAGDDATVSIILGSSSFYELLSNVEVAKRIMKHDNDLINTLTSERTQLEQLKTDLTAQKTAKDASLADIDAKKKKLDSSYATSKEKSKQLDANEKAFIANKAKILEEEAKIEAAIKEEIRKKAVRGTYVGGEYIWPVPGYSSSSNISSGYGWRSYGGGTFHKGVDIAGSGIAGKNIVASNAGTVIAAVTSYTPHVSYGRYVMIDHGGGNVTLYGHCEGILVAVGQTVTQGQPIATVGNTGDSTGYHCHFEIRINGETINPMSKFTLK